MAISSISAVVPPVQHSNPHQVKTHRDSDGDNDHSKAGEVEKSAVQQSKASPSETLGTNIDTKA